MLEKLSEINRKIYKNPSDADNKGQSLILCL